MLNYQRVHFVVESFVGLGEYLWVMRNDVLHRSMALENAKMPFVMENIRKNKGPETVRKFDLAIFLWFLQV
jgi:hypothetical protein